MASGSWVELNARFGPGSASWMLVLRVANPAADFAILGLSWAIDAHSQNDKHGLLWRQATC